MTTSKHKYQGKIRDLDTIPYHEIQSEVDKIRRKQQRDIAIRAELNRQIEAEHPQITHALPYLRVAGVILALVVFFIALWIIMQVNASSNVPV